MVDPADSETEARDGRRRRFLKYGALAAFFGTGLGGAWVATRSNDPPEPMPTETPVQTDAPTPKSTPTADVPARVSRFAPDLYFDALEQWYPTDPRPYIITSDDRPVVDGFRALEDYSLAARDGTVPDPTVFYHVVEATPGVDAIQYWMYSVFDQFTVNFHWHDWELLQVFVESDTGRPLLVSASAHSRAVPNNEYFEPALGDGSNPGVLVELGSHSSGSEVNGRLPSFERFSIGNVAPDITNDVVDIASGVSAPFAYGLPRDEGARLPFVMPELGGNRLDQYLGLSIAREDFIAEEVTVDTWRGIPRPPREVPLRENGLVMAHSDSETQADVTYTLKPIGGVRDAVADFVGPQLSFEFAIPGFVEDQFANHITSVGIPWEQERFRNPLDDVTDPTHRRRLDAAQPPGLANRVVGRVRQLRAGAEGALGRVADAARDAVEDDATVSLFGLPVEVAVLLASDHAVARVTRGGVLEFLHVDPGEHQLTVNGPGIAPLAVRFDHDGGLVQAGAAGDLTVVANENAGWIRGATRNGIEITRLQVTEDYAGVVFSGRPVEADRFAIAVHPAGQYTVEILDPQGRRGAFRVGPGMFGDDGDVILDGVRLGKRSLITTLVDLIAAARDMARRLAERDDARGTVIEIFFAALEHAETAAASADRSDTQGANESLSRIVALMEEAREVLRSEDQDGYSDAAVAALLPRVTEIRDRAETAIETELTE